MRSFFRELQSGPQHRLIAANLGWLALDKGVRLVLGLFVGTWVARYLGPTEFGVLSFALAIGTLLAILPALGLDPIVRRELVPSGAPVQQLLGTTFLLRAAVAAFVYLVFVAGIFLFSADTALRQILLWSGLLVLQPALLTPELWFHARQSSRPAILAQNTAYVIASLVRIGLILAQAPLAAFAAIIILDLILFAVLLARSTSRHRCGPSSWRFDPALARSLLKRGWPLLLSSLAVVIYLKTDQVMLNLLAGPTAAGHYAAAVRISEICYAGPLILATSLFPALVRARAGDRENYSRRIRQYLNFSAAFAYAAAIPLALAAPFVVRMLYGEPFSPTAPILALHIFSLVFVAQGVARQEWLLGHDHTRFALITTAAGALLNVGLNFVLIPRHGALGAAVATLVSLAASDVLSSLCWSPTRSIGVWQLRALLGLWKLPRWSA